MDTDTINMVMARLEGVVLKPRLDELRDQQAHVDAVRRRLGRRLRYHAEHGTRSSMSISHADLHVLLDALDRAEDGRAAS